MAGFACRFFLCKPIPLLGTVTCDTSEADFLRVPFPLRGSFSRKAFAWGGVRKDRRRAACGFQKSRREIEYQPDRLGIPAVDFGNVGASQKFQISLASGRIQLLPGLCIV